MKTAILGTSSLLFAAILSGPAAAQGAAQTQESAEVAVLQHWSYDTLYAHGWSVEEMIDDTEVLDPSGEDIGDVENLIFRDNGEVLAVIAEIGGLLDIGDTHVSIPWDEVEISADLSQMTVPITEETVDNYSVFAHEDLFFESDAGEVQPVDDDVVVGPEVFKATDLIGDFAYLENVRYGYVNDVLVEGNRLAAVVVDANAYGRPGYYAYPYRDYSIGDPYHSRFNLPYVRDEIATIEQFDYDRVQRSPIGDGADDQM